MRVLQVIAFMLLMIIVLCLVFITYGFVMGMTRGEVVAIGVGFISGMMVSLLIDRSDIDLGD